MMAILKTNVWEKLLRIDFIVKNQFINSSKGIHSTLLDSPLESCLFYFHYTLAGQADQTIELNLSKS